VGDTYFQHKSFERIRQYRRAGTTLLLVSHDKQAIQSVCDRAILLDGRPPGARVRRKKSWTTTTP
jgi:lipopolysaccharide transport system ATP-binding protein